MKISNVSLALFVTILKYIVKKKKRIHEVTFSCKLSILDVCFSLIIFPLCSFINAQQLLTKGSKNVSPVYFFLKVMLNITNIFTQHQNQLVLRCVQIVKPNYIGIKMNIDNFSFVEKRDFHKNASRGCEHLVLSLSKQLVEYIM